MANTRTINLTDLQKIVHTTESGAHTCEEQLRKILAVRSNSGKPGFFASPPTTAPIEKCLDGVKGIIKTCSVLQSALVSGQALGQGNSVSTGKGGQ